jgi:hypothetical protein
MAGGKYRKGSGSQRTGKSSLRANVVRPLDPNGEHISDAALGLDDARRARVAFKLAPQAKNLHVDAAIENIPMQARGLQQVLAAERALWRFEKGEQQGIPTGCASGSSYCTPSISAYPSARSDRKRGHAKLRLDDSPLRSCGTRAGRQLQHCRALAGAQARD